MHFASCAAHGPDRYPIRFTQQWQRQSGPEQGRKCCGRKSIGKSVATRYGHTPTRRAGGGIGETFGWLRGKVTELGSSPFDRLTYDLVARASSVLWYTAWVHAFVAIGDAESARELAALLTEKEAHCRALQEGLNRLVERRVQVADAVAPSTGVSPAIGTV